MIRLRTILQSKLLYLFLIVISIFIVIYFNNVKEHESIYNISDNKFFGVVKKIDVDEKYISFFIKAKENLVANYYFSSDKSNIEGISLGDYVMFTGTLKVPNKNTNPNLFNYKNYLYHEGVFYILEIDNFKIIKKNKNILFGLKNYINSKLSNTKEDSYIKAFVLGNDNYISEDFLLSYRNLGISHLFAVSGMHVSFILGILLFALEKLNINKYIVFIITIIVLIIYMFLVNYSPSVLRTGIFYILLRLNDIFKIKLTKIKVLIISVFIIILINPFIIYKIGFIYSSIISFYLLLFSDLITKKKNYFSKILMTSFIAWIVSIPISSYFFFQINLLTVFYNIIFVPLITLIIFPLSFITFIFPCFKPIYLFFINIFEFLALKFNNINSILILKKPNLILVVIYFIIITLILFKLIYKKRIYLFLLILLIIFHYNYNFFRENNFFIMTDIGQAECFIFHSNNSTLLIDSGGKLSINKNKNNSKTIISILKSFGITKIDYIILSHGDYDHMGEAINLVENFKVEKVIFNCGEFNELEQDLIKVLDKKKIPYYSCIKELNISDNKLYFLNNKDYGNENDNSSVIYTKLNNYKFLFMGDAGVEVEEDLIGKYNLKNIDVLKVGHHASKTSSSKTFIDAINPKYSIISVGKNNRYGHPNDSVLDNLEDSKIYRTDQDGSVMFKIKNNKLNVETCAP